MSTFGPCAHFSQHRPRRQKMHVTWNLDGFRRSLLCSSDPASSQEWTEQQTVATNKCRSGCHLTPHFDKYYSTHELQIAIDNMHILQYINYKNTYVIHCYTMMYIPMCNVVMIVHRDMQLTGRVRYCMYVSWHCHWHWYWNLKSLMTSCLTAENLWNFWNKTKINNDVSCNR